MKNTFKVFGIIACLAIIGVFMSACPQPGDSDPGNGLSALTGTVSINNTSPKVGDTLTATYNPGNGTGTATWVWLRGAEIIADANSNTYAVTAEDLGAALTARVSFADQSGSISSAATGAVASSNLPALSGTVTINNTSPKVGDTLTATYNPGNGTGTATWIWLRGSSIITGANSNTYTVEAADLGATLTARVSFANQSGSVSSAATGAVASSNLPALTGSVTINNTAPKVGDTLTATYNPGNGTGTATWVWLRGATIITGANSNTYTVEAADLGATLTARVSFANQSGSISSAATAAVAAAGLPALTGTVTINNTTPKVGDTLTATYNPGNGTGTATWIWLRGATIITSANSNTYTVEAADLSSTLTARVSFANQSGNISSTATGAVAAADLPALTGTVTINNTTPKVGDTLIATYNPGNGTGTATWVWLRGIEIIPGEGINTYEVTAADLSATLTAQVSFADQSGSISSTATSAVVLPNLTGTVTINNTSPKVGDALTATYNPGNGTGTATWEWLADNNIISGANSHAYTVSINDAGKQLKARISYTDQSGSVESDPSAVVPQPTELSFTYEQLADITVPIISASTIHLIEGTGRPTSATFTVGSPELYDADSIKWYYNGNQITESIIPGAAISGNAGEILTINTSPPSTFRSIMTYLITVEVLKDGIQFSKLISLTVAP